jgi:hypothetical protein
MMVVEIHISDAATLSEAMAEMRQWLDHRRFQPAVFHYTFKESCLLLRIEFGTAAEAREFAQAFHGAVAEAQYSPQVDYGVGRPPVGVLA